MCRDVSCDPCVGNCCVGQKDQISREISGPAAEKRFRPDRGLTGRRAELRGEGFPREAPERAAFSERLS